MAYCRFSTNDFQCDLHVYADDYGYTTHLARHKAEFGEPLPQPVPFESPAFVERYGKVVQLFGVAKQIAIDLPLAGETFEHDTAEASLNRLIQLRHIGYRFPETVIDAIRAEAYPESADRKWYVEVYVGGDFAGAYGFDTFEEAEADLMARKKYQVKGLYYELAAHPHTQERQAA